RFHKRNHRSTKQTRSRYSCDQEACSSRLRLPGGSKSNEALRFASNFKDTRGLTRVYFFVRMKSAADTPMVVSSCEPPKNVFPIPISNNDMRDHDPGSVFDRFVRCGLAGNTQQRAAWEFSRVASPARVLSLRLVRSDSGHR